MPPSDVLERRRKEKGRPSYLDEQLISAENWLEHKRLDDNLQGLWRIHDKLYDLSKFIDKHPGGRQWLELSKGTDCTEAFESHHVEGKAEAILPKFFVKTASTPRDVDYTFHADGFYKTLKTEAQVVLKILPIKQLEIQSKIIIDAMAFMTFFMAGTAAYNASYIIATISGFFLALTAIASHNFFHKKDSWRMYYFHLSLLSVRDWRISHTLSHHSYPNTLQDMDVTGFEPFFNYLPDPRKNVISRFVSWAYYPFIYATMFHSEFFTRCIHNTLSKSELLTASTIPTLLFFANGGNIISAFLMWTWILCVGSLTFHNTDVVATHRHPETFIQGDAPRKDRDWGLAQIDTTKDNQWLTGNAFFAMILFADHTLHHLFPTVDHSVLKFLYPVFLQTCKKFNVTWKADDRSFQMATAEFRALARNKPNPCPPN
nr:PREDICTED: cytochrome b5-related protein-like [Bemisia tabaci]XP_018907183.1 PREDICTED: cytochrome b5-related protein-like [Bemisia tabaci]